MVHGALRSNGWTQLIPRTDTNAAAAGHDGRVLGLMLTPPRRARRSARACALLALALALLAVAPNVAQAQGPIGLGAGQDPAIVVDAAGTGHVVFDVQGGEFYCRLPRAATACDVATFLPLANGTGRAAIMDRPDGTLLIVRATSDDSPDGALRGTSFYRVSGDRGATWSPPTPFAYGNADFTKVALAPGGQSVLTLDLETSLARLQSAALAGGETRTTALYDPEQEPAFADVTPMPDGRVVSIVGDLSAVQWSVFGGGDIYDPNTWTARGRLRGIFNAEVFSGPRGTFLFEHEPLGEQRTAGFDPPFRFRSLDTRRLRWRASRAAGADRSIFGSSTAIQDARGRLHVIADTTSATSWTCVLYARTGPRSSSWFGKTTVLFRTRDSDRAPHDVRVGAAPDGRGFAVWEDATGIAAMPLRQAGGTYRAKRNQNDRPACTGSRYG